MAEKVTKGRIDGLLTKPGYHFLGEPKGFGLRVTNKGAMFFVQGRIRGSRKVIRISLGKYGQITLEQAKALAKIKLGDLARGIDPNQEAVKMRASDKREKLQSQLTLGAVFEQYCSDRRQLKPSTREGYTAKLKKCVPDWMNLPIKEITKDMIEKRHKKLSSIVRKNGDYRPGEWSGGAQANQVMRILRAVFNYAQVKYDEEGLDLPANPVQRLTHIQAWNRVPRRQTVIKPHELKPWHDSVMELPNEIIRDFLRILLFTGLRREEAAQLTWSNIDFKGQTLKVIDTKNGDDHMLPLTPYMYDLLLKRWQSRKEGWQLSSPYVFPSQDSGSGYIAEPRKQMAMITRSTGLKFTCHDLRRTFATIAEGLDIQGYTLKRLMNHRSSSDVTGGYIIADAERLRKPMEQISKFITDKVEAVEATQTNVIPLKEVSA